MAYILVETLLVFFLLFFPTIVLSNNPKLEVPNDKSNIDRWFTSTFGKAALKPAAIGGAGLPRVIRVSKDGRGGFKTVSDAVKSIPDGNKRRVIVWIGPGNYTEKIVVKDKPFVTFYGDPKNVPVLLYGGTAAKYSTVDSATLSVDSDHFVGVNLKVVNTAPRPDGKRIGAQAAALRVGGDATVFYNCKFYGFQDTVFDFKGRHLFKDCYIEGTVDFIFGSAKSIYLNTEIHVIPGDKMAMITAHARSDNSEATGFIFLHCTITGTGQIAYLGRSWFPYPKVVYAFCYLSDVVQPEGWSNNFHPETNKTAFFGEFENKGPGAILSKRVGFSKKLKQQQAKEFISLAFIEADAWLQLPPSKI